MLAGALCTVIAANRRYKSLLEKTVTDENASSWLRRQSQIGKPRPVHNVEGLLAGKFYGMIPQPLPANSDMHNEKKTGSYWAEEYATSTSQFTRGGKQVPACVRNSFNALIFSNFLLGRKNI